MRPDIAYITRVVNRFLSNPGKEHWVIVKWILRYLRGTFKTCLCFGIDKHVLVGCTNVDMARDVDSRKSTSDYLITFFRRSNFMAIKVVEMSCFLDHRG